ncbi:hypothetical protein [Streptacidiphilus sp. EB103A]|uniref:hypothetical protein n=1 Tax=Streptacidiphilus sp. EB103A TaxID=3156275 RepID=UPI003516EB35
MTPTNDTRARRLAVIAALVAYMDRTDVETLVEQLAPTRAHDSLKADPRALADVLRRSDADSPAAVLLSGYDIARKVFGAAFL